MRQFICMVIIFELLAYLIVSFITWDFLWLDVWSWEPPERLLLLWCFGCVAIISFIFKIAMKDLRDIIYDR